MSYNGGMSKENLEHYLQVEQRPFGEAPLTDVDLMAFAALIYAEFERFPLVYDEAASIPIGDMPRYGTPWEYVEHDCHPKGMLPFVEALFANPRFTGIPLQRFRCIVDEERGVQFGAGCFPLPDGRVVMAYRGTNTLLVGWQENIDLIWQVEGPGEAEALRYFVEAAAAYPNASFIVCGHSKGGGLADHVAVYAPNELLPRIERVVTFDGPPSFRLGDISCPEFGDLDDIILARYDQLPFPLQRYIFPSMVALMLERRDPGVFTYTEAVDSRAHNLCSVHIVDGRIATRTPSAEELQTGMLTSRWVQLMSLDLRCFISTFIVGACRAANTSINLDNLKPLIAVLLRGFHAASPDAKVKAARLVGYLLKANSPSAPLIYRK